MSVTEDPGPPAQPEHMPEPSEKSFWAQLHPDIRTLIVTVAGTVVGGIVLVMVVAVAVILAKTFLGPHPTPAHVHNVLEGYGAGAGLTLVLVLLGIRDVRHRESLWGLDLAALPVLTMLFLLSVLVLLGVAAGVK